MALQRRPLCRRRIHFARISIHRELQFVPLIHRLIFCRCRVGPHHAALRARHPRCVSIVSTRPTRTSANCTTTCLQTTQPSTSASVSHFLSVSLSQSASHFGALEPHIYIFGYSHVCTRSQMSRRNSVYFRQKNNKNQYLSLSLQTKQSRLIKTCL